LGLYNNLAIGYIIDMNKASEAARTLAKRSVEARRQKWGEEEFKEKMWAWGKLGGRPTKKGKHNGR